MNGCKSVVRFLLTIVLTSLRMIVNLFLMWVGMLLLGSHASSAVLFLQGQTIPSLVLSGKLEARASIL